jgi:hypothetical protein
VDLPVSDCFLGQRIYDLKHGWQKHREYDWYSNNDGALRLDAGLSRRDGASDTLSWFVECTSFSVHNSISISTKWNG